MTGLVQRALSLQPWRPEGWAVGATVQYTVLRDGRELTLPVTIRQLRPTDMIDLVPRPFRLVSPVLLSVVWPSS